MTDISKAKGVSASCILRLGVKLCVAGIAMSVLFVALMMIAAGIDEADVRENVYVSELQLREEGQYDKIIEGLPLTQKDNFTDAIMIGMCALPDSTSLIRKSMHCTTLWTEGESNADAYVRYLEGDYSDTHDFIGHYSRYWLGFQCVLKPLLLKFDISQIRVINCAVMSVLVIISLILIACRISMSVALIYLMSLLAIFIPMVPLSLQFSTCFYIMLVSVIVLLAMPRARLTGDFLPVCFFIIGGVTAFLDFLTTPVLTLGIPLALALIYAGENGRVSVGLCAGCIICWFLGYAGLWGEKWVLATLLTEDDVIGNALTTAATRTSVYESVYPMRKLALILASVAILVLFVATDRYGRFAKSLRRKYRFLLIIAALPFVWYMALSQHSMQHFWFVWRSVAVSIFCYVSYICLIVNGKVSES